MTISVIVCAYNEEAYLPACLASLLAQTRPANEVIVVDNASTDGTALVAEAAPGVMVVGEPRKGLPLAREKGRRRARGDLLAFLDADCRAPADWLAQVEAEFESPSAPVAVTAGYRFYDWDLPSRALMRLYDCTVALLAHLLIQRVLRAGAVLYGGNFTVRRGALEAIGGFDTAIEFHGEDTNTGRRLSRVGEVRLAPRCWVETSARRWKAMGRLAVFRLYVRNFTSEILWRRPRDLSHEDIRS